jgi:UDP-glucose 4-epimerase
MNILVTGGAGFIGSHLAKALIQDGNTVYIIDNLTTGSIENLDKKCIFLNYDLAIVNLFDILPNNIDIIYHLASQASGEVSWENPINDLNANTLSTLKVLLWAKSNAVKKFIFTSTMGVYDDNLNYPVTEKSSLCPKSFYGINKLTCENYIRIFSEEGLDCTILRFFNVYGPGQNMQNLKQGMISIYMAYLNEKKPILIKGPLNRSRDFVFIDDVVNSLLLAQKKSNILNLYNVATGIQTSVDNLISILLETFNEPKDYPLEIQQRTPRDIDNVFGNYDLIKNDLNWEPKTNLSKGILLMYKWLKNYEKM